MAMVILQTIYSGVFGQKVKAPSGAEYQCSEGGLMKVEEADAPDFLCSSGWKVVPQEVVRKAVAQAKAAPKPEKAEEK